MKYRNGPVGALMDEYERAAEELIHVLQSVNAEDFIRVVDTDTEDIDCRSIQTIMNHVIRAGYGYANYIRKQYGDDLVKRSTDYNLTSPPDAIRKLKLMLAYTLETLENKWDITDEEVIKNIIHTSWGQDYDMEQLLEHAIVHVLRHRRQIERLSPAAAVNGD
ncbi:MAG: DinB family protein [Bacteroidetes bacterium]|nr:DinB family protein [Bacteroidota bacterium]